MKIDFNNPRTIPQVALSLMAAWMVSATAVELLDKPEYAAQPARRHASASHPNSFFVMPGSLNRKFTPGS